jgi:hypothetical protein
MDWDRCRSRPASFVETPYLCVCFFAWCKNEIVYQQLLRLGCLRPQCAQSSLYQHNPRSPWTEQQQNKVITNTTQQSFSDSLNDTEHWTIPQQNPVNRRAYSKMIARSQRPYHRGSCTSHGLLRVSACTRQRCLWSGRRVQCSIVISLQTRNGSKNILLNSIPLLLSVPCWRTFLILSVNLAISPCRWLQ